MAHRSCEYPRKRRVHRSCEYPRKRRVHRSCVSIVGRTRISDMSRFPNERTEQDFWLCPVSPVQTLNRISDHSPDSPVNTLNWILDLCSHSPVNRIHYFWLMVRLPIEQVEQDTGLLTSVHSSKKTHRTGLLTIVQISMSTTGQGTLFLPSIQIPQWIQLTEYRILIYAQTLQ